ncbi:hypothetical protein [Streptomyces sp. NPDC020141]|uniref:hypothetical protein n=1 Tax=Streptomyces sp. NPDC020141 TaxID=3365065 RepID=UPI0037A6631A
MYSTTSSPPPHARSTKTGTASTAADPAKTDAVETINHVTVRGTGRTASMPADTVTTGKPMTPTPPQHPGGDVVKQVKENGMIT